MKSEDISADSLLFGFIPLTTHRDRSLGPDATSYFQYEAVIAAISIIFFRLTVRKKTEPLALTFFFGILLGCLSYLRKSYELITAVELFSYASSLLLTQWPVSAKNNLLLRLMAIAASAVTSLLMSHLFLSPGAKGMDIVTAVLMPSPVMNVLNSMFPIDEFKATYNIMSSFARPEILQKQLAHLLFVTGHIQCGMGFLGIAFLTKEQSRRNRLIRLDLADEDSSETVSKATGSKSKETEESKVSARHVRARRFQRSAGPFILFAALPYMLQIITFGNINKFAFVCLEHDMHRIVRLEEIFEDHNNLAAMAADSATSPETYANSMTSVVSKAYDIINRKLFSLPKILLLPGVMARQPMLMVQVFPFIFLSDWVKATAVSYMTTTIEKLRKETMEVKAIRTKVESFDLKNAELLQRSGLGGTKFTQKRWEELTVKIQNSENVADLLARSKAFFAFMQRNFVFTVLIDCALASLIAIGKILASEIFVFSRAVEDAVDMVLMRSRSEAELAQMTTEINKLTELSDLWTRQKKEKTFLTCRLSTPADHKGLIVRNLHYSRGTASVRADHIELPPGIYALTGANGSGKSTLFRVLMSCNTNEQSTELPPSINLLTPMEPLMEDDDVLREKACILPTDNDDDEEAIVDDDCESGLSNQTKEKKVQHDEQHPRPRLSITMPSAHVVEISQNFYWPLYSKPIEWIFFDPLTGLHDLAGDELNKRSRIVAEHLHSLEFFQTVRKVESEDTGIENEEVSEATAAEATINRIQAELVEEKEDWFGDLSGGQKSKVELVRKVFLMEHCPEVLLVDETMAPLDPASKAVVMAKLKDFCSESIVIVIYHTDVGREVDVEGKSVDCVPSNDFFDNNIHLESGQIQIRATC